MASYRAVPVAQSIVEQARQSLRSPQYGHAAEVSVAASYGPCRSCLRTFEVGREERLLFIYDPFDGLDDYPEPGPVYVHRERCPEHRGDGFPEGLRGLPLTLEAFADERRLVRREHLRGRGPEPVIEELLALPEVRYLHLRNTEAGCFIARLERLAGEAA